MFMIIWKMSTSSIEIHSKIELIFAHAVFMKQNTGFRLLEESKNVRSVHERILFIWTFSFDGPLMLWPRLLIPQHDIEQYFLNAIEEPYLSANKLIAKIDLS